MAAWQIRNRMWALLEWCFGFWVALCTLFGYIYLGLCTVLVLVMAVLRGLSFFGLLHLHYNESSEDHLYVAALFVMVFLMVVRVMKATAEIKRHLGI